MQMLAWLQVNLINIQLPRGKPRLTMDKILPKRARKKVEQSDEAVEEAVEMLTAKKSDLQRMRARRAAARRQAEEDARFWRSPEGTKLAAARRALHGERAE